MRLLGLRFCASVTKLRPSGDTAAYSTSLSSEFSQGTGIAVDSFGEAYIAGNTGPGFPAFKSGFQNTYRGGNDGFVAKLNSSGSGLIWSTYLGGSGDDFIYLPVLVECEASDTSLDGQALQTSH